MADFTPEQIAALAGQLAQAFKGNTREEVSAQQKTITGVPTAGPNPFNAGGLFSQFGIDNVVINAMLSPRGIDAALPVVSSNELYPRYGFFTGIDPSGEAEPDGVCDDAPTGVMETCFQTAQFGRYTRGSKEMEVNELYQVLNGHLTTDLQLLGMGFGTHALLAQDMSNPAGFLTSMVKMQLVIAGQLLQQKLARQLWTGDPTNNSAGGGYKEFPGLEILVNTGKVDMFNGVTCPSLDPDVKDFAYEAVDSTTKDIVVYMTYITRWVKHVAERTGLEPVTWAWVMRQELFSELVEIWPCRYLTYRCQNSAGTAVAVMNDETNVRFRDAMRTGHYLKIDGVDWPVLIDDGITELNSTTDAHLDPGEFASDAYLLPFKIQGGRPVLYWEAMNYSSAMADVSFLQGKQFWATDGGRYLWTMQQLNYCFKFQAKIEPRIILRTPQLAGRLRHIKYSPLQHMRDGFFDSPYRLKGGSETFDTAPSFFNEW